MPQTPSPSSYFQPILSDEQWERLESWCKLWPRGQRDIMALADFGQSLLHISALIISFKDIFDVALRVGCPINARDHLRVPPLFYALRGQNQEALSSLVEHGADLTLSDCHGDGLLHIALRSGFWSEAEYLIEQGVCLNQVNLRGETALHEALSRRTDISCALVQKMVQHGYDLSLKDQDGKTCLDIIEGLIQEDWTLYSDIHLFLLAFTEKQQLKLNLEERVHPLKEERL